MKIQLKLATLHNPLFLAGTNFGSTLDVSKRTGLTLLYDRVEKELHAFYNNSLVIIPSTNVATMTPVDPSILGYPNAVLPITPKVILSSSIPVQGVKVKAQASVPAGIKND